MANTFTHIFTSIRVFPEKATAPHSSIFAWEIPWMEEPGRLQSMGSLRVGHDWATFMCWRRKWQPTPVFLPGESQGRGSLVGCHLWGSHRVGHNWCDLAAAAAAESSQVAHPASVGDAGDAVSIPRSGRSPGGGNDNSLQSSFLENPMDRGTWWLQSMGSQRVKHTWTTEHACHTYWPMQIYTYMIIWAWKYRKATN